MTIFVVSDTHFGHKNFINFKDEKGNRIRPFSSIEEMDELMVENWNKVVSVSDIVYHLGDVYFGDGWKHLSRLKGKKRLILGNHDEGKDVNLHKHFQKILMWRMFPDYKFILSHVPLHESNLKVYLDESPDHQEGDRGPVQKVFRNLHGHIHQNPSPNANYINCCVEWTNYSPVSLETILIDNADRR